MITNLTHYLNYTTKNYRSKPALIFGNQIFTYDQINEQSNHLSWILKQLGTRQRDRILIIIGNEPCAILLFWAVLKCDAVSIIINPTQPKEKLEFIINDCDPKIIITLNDSDLPNNKQPIITVESLLRLIKNSDHNSLTSIYPNITPKNLDIDLAAIIYTSGSTGKAKGVMLTHRNMTSAIQSINKYLETSNSDLILSALPISFDYGLYQMLLAFAVGATLILEKDFLLPIQILKAIAQKNISTLPCVATMIPLLFAANAKGTFNLSSVHTITNTGTSLTEKHIAQLNLLFPAARIFSMYGLTECKRCTYLPPKDLKIKPKSVGIPIPNTEIWVIDDNGNQLASNQIGQIVVRGATVMTGYWNNPASTAKKLKPGLIPHEKVLWTGDYGYMDEDGYLYLQGRLDEVIKTRGLKVSTHEIEQKISDLQGIHEVAVFGIPDEIDGEAICLFVSLEDETITTTVLNSICQKNFEAYKRPKHVHILSTLPKSSNGKIDKQVLKDKHMGLIKC